MLPFRCHLLVSFHFLVYSLLFQLWSRCYRCYFAPPLWLSSLLVASAVLAVSCCCCCCCCMPTLPLLARVVLFTHPYAQREFPLFVDTYHELRAESLPFSEQYQSDRPPVLDVGAGSLLDRPSGAGAGQTAARPAAATRAAAGAPVSRTGGGTGAGGGAAGAGAAGGSAPNDLRELSGMEAVKCVARVMGGGERGCYSFGGACSWPADSGGPLASSRDREVVRSEASTQVDGSRAKGKEGAERKRPRLCALSSVRGARHRISSAPVVSSRTAAA